MLLIGITIKYEVFAYLEHNFFLNQFNHLWGKCYYLILLHVYFSAKGTPKKKKFAKLPGFSYFFVQVYLLCHRGEIIYKVFSF
jgi:hypothetical protein